MAVIDWLLLLAFVAGTRLAARTIFERPAPGGLVARGKKVLVVGAGDAGQLVIREMLKSRALGFTPIGVVDDDRRKKNLRIHGIRVLGTTEELPHILRDNKPDELLIAIPSAAGEVRQKVVEAARCPRPGQDAPRPVRVDRRRPQPGGADSSRPGRGHPRPRAGRGEFRRDLRVPARRDRARHRAGVDRLELCRQVARAGAARLILVDQAESALYEIERELVDDRGFPASVPVIADVGNREKLRQVFDRYRPAIVFHAAAYKHVPMMEANPLESVRNNILGTKVVAEVAVEFQARRFVLISTDKALNAQAVYGQSKALCEWIVEAYGQRDDVATRFVAVRFGNVLDSSGSVIRIFKRQIAKGGPVTITHPEMTLLHDDSRGGLTRRPGRIDRRPGRDLRPRHGRAREDHGSRAEHDPPLGKEPDREIPLEFIGARRREAARGALGENETITSTEHLKIKRATRPPVDGVWLEEELGELERLVAAGETLDVVSPSMMVRSPRRVDVSVAQEDTVSEQTIH